MADVDLEQIRKQRLAQLQAQGKQPNNANNQQQAAQQEQQIEDMRNAILSQVLDQSARARLNTLRLGKPEKGKMVENMIISMAQKGQLMGKLSEKELINILENINKQTSKRITSVKFDRRKAAMDSDDDL